MVSCLYVCVRRFKSLIICQSNVNRPIETPQLPSGADKRQHIIPYQYSALVFWQEGQILFKYNTSHWMLKCNNCVAVYQSIPG